MVKLVNNQKFNTTFRGYHLNAIANSDGFVSAVINFNSTLNEEKIKIREALLRAKKQYGRAFAELAKE